MYCDSFTNYKRFNTKPVAVGNVLIGAKFPIRIQTMTNTLTKDTESTVNQIISCYNAGADIVRITTPTMKDVEALIEMKQKLKEKYEDKPIIADVHFNHKVAISATKNAEKVRINPGNFLPTKKTEFSEEKYHEELEKIKKICQPLIETSKENKTAIRIGTNHGSLSERIIYKYGNTVKGLVAATIEYIEIFNEQKFFDIVISVKSSNPTIMIQANRLLVEQMRKKKLNFPIHLGVTEAGNKLEGRIKSALGIGALLIDGIGDTIRVSLTEKPEKELPVAKEIINHINNRKKAGQLPEINHQFFNPYTFQRRKTYQVANIGGSNLPVVVTKRKRNDLTVSEFSSDYNIISNTITTSVAGTKNIIPLSQWHINTNAAPLASVKEYLLLEQKIPLCFVEANYQTLTEKIIHKAQKNKNVVIIAEALKTNTIGELRLLYAKLSKYNAQIPVIIKLEYKDENANNYAIKAAIDSSVFLIDGLADGILLVNNKINNNKNIEISYGILQASHRRLSKAEYISCPSCGRTLFDLEKVTEKVKKSTKHLKGIKIAVMGCIVNGPGEVADADYGYIGSSNKTVTLFKGKKPIKKNIDEKFAVDELINLIKENGDWHNP